MSNLATIEVMQSITVKQGAIVEVWTAGSLVVLPLATAQLIAARVGHKVRLIQNRSVHPLVGCPVFLEDKLKPWIVTGATDEAADRSLLLYDFLEEAHFTRDTDIRPYRCSTCNGTTAWWDLHGVHCATCVRPQPRWDRGWAELEHLTQNLRTNPNRTLLQTELDRANEAFSRGSYPDFQRAVIRARWGMPPRVV